MFFSGGEGHQNSKRKATRTLKDNENVIQKINLHSKAVLTVIIISVYC